MNKFTAIIGAKLECISESDATYIDIDENSKVINIRGCSLIFDTGSFVIENPYTLLGARSINELLEKIVVDAFSNSNEILLTFNNGTTISVSLKDDDFVSPEAAIYTPKNGAIIVFN